MFATRGALISCAQRSRGRRARQQRRHHRRPQAGALVERTVADALIDINFRAAVHVDDGGAAGHGAAQSAATSCSRGRSPASRPTANTAIYSATKAALQRLRRRVADGSARRGCARHRAGAGPGRDQPVRRGVGRPRCRGRPAVLGGNRRCRPADVAGLVGMALSDAGTRRRDPPRGRSDDAGLRWQHHCGNRLVFRIVGWFRNVESDLELA